MMMFTDCSPQFSFSGIDCKPSPSAFIFFFFGLSLNEVWPHTNHRPPPLSAWPYIKIRISPPSLLKLGLQEIPVATAFPVSWEFPPRQLLLPPILNIFLEKVVGLRSLNKEGELLLSLVHLRIHIFTCCIPIHLMKKVFCVS